MGPDDEAAIAREGGGELGSDEGLRDAPYEGEDEEAEDCKERPGGPDCRLFAVGAAGNLEVD